MKNYPWGLLIKNYPGAPGVMKNTPGALGASDNLRQLWQPSTYREAKNKLQPLPLPAGPTDWTGPTDQTRLDGGGGAGPDQMGGGADWSDIRGAEASQEEKQKHKIRGRFY